MEWYACPFAQTITLSLSVSSASTLVNICAFFVENGLREWYNQSEHLRDDRKYNENSCLEHTERLEEHDGRAEDRDDDGAS